MKHDCRAKQNSKLSALIFARMANHDELAHEGKKAHHVGEMVLPSAVG